MTIASNQLITAEDYNEMAYLVNKLWFDANLLGDTFGNPNPGPREYFADGTGSNASACNSIYSRAVAWSTDTTITALQPYAYTDIIPGGTALPLDPAPVAGDFIVVQVGNVVMLSGYNINYSNGTITFTSSISPNVNVVVYNRQTHIFGWGQGAAVYPVATADEITAGNVNTLIDRTNTMLRHVADPGMLSRVAVSAKIFASDQDTIESTIDDDLVAGRLHLTMDSSVASISDASDFTNPLIIRETGTWTNVNVTEATYTFTNYADARYFFNSGASLRLSLAVDAGDNGNDYWEDLADAMGNVSLKWNNTTNDGDYGFPQNLGFYHLTDQYQLLFRSGGARASFGHYAGYGGYGDYSLTNLEVWGKIRIVGNTVAIDLKIELDDTVADGTGVLSDGTVGPNATVSLFFVKADNYVDNTATLNINGPSDMSVLSIGDFDESVDNYNPS